MAGEPIRTAIVAGSGIVAWSAAAALRRNIPRLAVALLATPTPPEMSDRISSTLPSIVDFHRDLGLAESDTILRVRSAFRLGNLFAGWSGKESDFVHAYGEHGKPFGTAAFHLHWIGLRRQGKALPFDHYSAPAAMGRAGRFAPPMAATRAALGAFGFGLRLDLAEYARMIRAYALHLGVIERRSGIAGLRLDPESGFIAALRLDDGSEAKADLFVDCTGEAALIRAALDDKRADWSRWLPCDRLLTGKSEPVSDPDPLDRIEAVEAGWRWRSDGAAATSRGLAYASAWLADEAAARLIGEEAPAAPIAFGPGFRPEPWLRNCVAIGDSAILTEPLEWTSLHLAHSAIDRLVSMMPDRNCHPVEIANYNREARAEGERVRDFLALHYLAAGRDEPFWREMAGVQPPDTLAHSLSLFRERGRLPYYEEETFTRDSWLAVLFGLGIFPEHEDALIGSVPAAAAERNMAEMREAIDAALPGLPTPSAFMRDLTRQAKR